MVLGIPTKALSLDGSLGLAFGARGSGGVNAAKAHYEPGQVVINLTKRTGPGSLAHEWFHGLDNYFSRLNKTGSTAPVQHPGFATSANGPGAMRPEVAQAFKAIHSALNKGTFDERSTKLDEARSASYYGTMVEKAARAFETYLVDRLAKSSISNDYLVNIVKDGSPAYPTPAEMNGGIRGAFDQLFNTLDTKETDKGTALFAAEPEEEQPAEPLTERAKAAQAKIDRLHELQSRKPLQPEQAALLARQHEIMAEERAKQNSPTAQPQTTDPSKVSSIRDLVSSATQERAPARRQFTHYATVSAAQATKLKASTGLDLEGYKRNLDNYAVRHAWNEHGDAQSEAARGNRALTKEDFQKLPQFLANPDASILAGKNSRGQDVILSAKRVNGYYVIAEEVRDKPQVLSLATIYKKVAPPLAIGASEPTPLQLQSTAQGILQQAARQYKLRGSGGNENTLAAAEPEREASPLYSEDDPLPPARPVSPMRPPGSSMRAPTRPEPPSKAVSPVPARNDFASQVERAALAVPVARRFGGDKAFISEVHDNYPDIHPGAASDPRAGVLNLNTPFLARLTLALVKSQALREYARTYFFFIRPAIPGHRTRGRGNQRTRSQHHAARGLALAARDRGQRCQHRRLLPLLRAGQATGLSAILRFQNGTVSSAIVALSHSPSFSLSVHNLFDEQS